MNITLDHNCIIHLENRTQVGTKIAEIVADKNNECYVVNIGASEMRKMGIRPDNYDKFEELLTVAGVAHLRRLNPMAFWGITFWDRALWTDDVMKQQSDAIYNVLFGTSKVIDPTSIDLDSNSGHEWINRICDVQGMWCHIQNRNDVFLTTDENFSKKMKLSRLVTLGAKRICHPNQL